jgi:hypothetical protein
VVPSVETFARLKHGMTEQEVVAIFGQPTRRQQAGGGGLSAFGLFWERPTHPTLYVVIDPSGKLVKATLMSGGTILANLRVRPQ